MPMGTLNIRCSVCFFDDPACFNILFTGADSRRGDGGTLGKGMVGLAKVAKSAGRTVLAELSGFAAGPDVGLGVETLIKRTAECSSREMRTASRNDFLASASRDSMPRIL